MRHIFDYGLLRCGTMLVWGTSRQDKIFATSYKAFGLDFPEGRFFACSFQSLFNDPCAAVHGIYRALEVDCGSVELGLLGKVNLGFKQLNRPFGAKVRVDEAWRW